MSGLIGIAQDTGFSPRLFAVDDHPSELNEIFAIAKDENIQIETCDTVLQFGFALQKATGDDIVLSDNQIEGVNNLSMLGEGDIETGGGTNTGIALLTSYCDAIKCKTELRILLTGYAIDGKSDNFLRRRAAKTNSVGIITIHKEKPNYLPSLRSIISNHVRKRYAIFLQQKIQYTQDLFDQWQLTVSERCRLFGVADVSDPVWLAVVGKSSTSRDFEARCDLIYRIRLSLVQANGEIDPEQEARWFRTKLRPLDNLSPLEFLGAGYQHRLAELALRLESPT